MKFENIGHYKMVSLNFAKNLQGCYFGVGGPKNFKHLADSSLIVAVKIFYCRVYSYVV